MASSKQRAVTDVPLEGWVRFGRILQEWREDVLGYKTRAEFVRKTGINLRLAQELENSPAYRAGTYTKWALGDAEKAYQVTRESMLAVLHGEADSLAPAREDNLRTLPGDPDDPPGWPPERVASDRPFFDEINERRVELAFKGIAYPTGAEMFGEGTEDATAWDTEGAPLPVGDRVWFIADLRRRAAGRDARPEADGAGA